MVILLPLNILDAKETLLGNNQVLKTYPSLDRALKGGFSRKKQVVLFGATKSGKTTIAIDLISKMIESNENLTNKYKIVINWFTLELTKDDMFNRLLTRYLHKVEKITISPSDLEMDTGYLKQSNFDISNLYDKCEEYYNSKARIAVYDFPTDGDTIISTIDTIMTKYIGDLKEDKFVYKKEHENIFLINVIDHLGLILPSKS